MNVTLCNTCAQHCEEDHLKLTRDGEGMTIGGNMMIGGNDELHFCKPYCLFDWVRTRLPAKKET